MAVQLAIVVPSDFGADFDAVGAQTANKINLSASLKAALQQVDMGIDNASNTNGVFGVGTAAQTSYDLGMMSDPRAAVSDLGLLSQAVGTAIDLGLFSS